MVLLLFLAARVTEQASRVARLVEKEKMRIRSIVTRSFNEPISGAEGNQLAIVAQA